MTATPQAPPTENIYGIAKRISLDLEKYPLHTHAAIISVVNTMCQHRKIVMEQEIEQKQMEANEAAMADARRAHAEAQVRRDSAIAQQINKAAEEPNPPRLSIVLEKPAEQETSGHPSPELSAKDEALQSALTEEVSAS